MKGFLYLLSTSTTSNVVKICKALNCPKKDKNTLYYKNFFDCDISKEIATESIINKGIKYVAEGDYFEYNSQNQLKSIINTLSHLPYQMKEKNDEYARKLIDEAYNCWYETNEQNKAKELLKKVIDLKVKEGYKWLGSFYESEDNYSEAQKIYQRAIADKFLDFHFDLVRIYYHKTIDTGDKKYTENGEKELVKFLEYSKKDNYEIDELDRETLLLFISYFYIKDTKFIFKLTNFTKYIFEVIFEFYYNTSQYNFFNIISDNIIENEKIDIDIMSNIISKQQKLVFATTFVLLFKDKIVKFYNEEKEIDNFIKLLNKQYEELDLISNGLLKNKENIEKLKKSNDNATILAKKIKNFINPMIEKNNNAFFLENNIIIMIILIIFLIFFIKRIFMINL
jgi:hypothetical protein